MQLPPDDGVKPLRAVHRAASELRRGTPVLLRGPEGALLLAAAETVSARGLAGIAAAAVTAPMLLLAPIGAEAMHEVGLGEPAVVALRLPLELLDPAMLRSMADPTAERLLPAEPERVTAPLLAPAAILLAKLARLVPALVAAPATEAALALVDLLSVTAAEVAAYPHDAAATLSLVAAASVPLENAPEARILAFRLSDGGVEHLAILVGQPEAALSAGRPPLVCIHSECFTSDLLDSLGCDYGPRLRGAIRRMADDPAGGVLLYLAQEGRGIGLVSKLCAYTLQNIGVGTQDANGALGHRADERNFWVAAEMLRVVGIGQVRLLTNNPDEVAGLAACGVAVEGHEMQRFAENCVNDAYLATNAGTFGDMLA